MVLKYYYSVLASTVRVRSESLCLDHTFVPAASVDPISLQDLWRLAYEEDIDSVYVFIPKAAEAYYMDCIDNEEVKVSVCGWIELNKFEAVEPYA